MSVTRSQRCLVILMGSLGDLARGLAIVPALRSVMPSLHITWLVEAAYEPLLRCYAGIDEIVVFERKRGWQGFLAVRRALRARTFDLTLDLQRILKSGLFSRWSHAPRRVGFHRQDSKEGNWLFQTETIPRSQGEVPKIQQYLAFATTLGGASDGACRWTWGQLPTERVRERYLARTGSRRIGIVLGSRWPSKDWLPEGYQRLLQALGADGDLVLLGDRSVQQLADRLVSVVRAPVHNLVGKTDLVELAAVLQQCTVVVGPDSGPGHLAASLGVRCVTVMGPTSPVRVAPYGGEELVVRAPVGCAPCLRRSCPGLDKLCMRLIKPEDVAVRVRDVLSGAQPS